MRADKRAIFLAFGVALFGVAGCAETAEQEAGQKRDFGPKVLCQMDGRRVVTSRYTCLLKGDDLIAEPVVWKSEAIKVRWQGRDEITLGKVHYQRGPMEGLLRLDLMQYSDVCEAPYRLESWTDAEWSATCESGRTVALRVFFDEGGIAISGYGEDGEGRQVGFYPQPGGS